MLQNKARAWMEIDLGKVHHNVAEIQKIIPKQTKIMGVVKANAYGHGDVQLAKELQACGIDFFAVSSVDEALNLYEAGIKKEPILILGYTPPVHFHHLLGKENIIQTVFSLTYGEKLNQFFHEHHDICRVHIKVDTGMSRLGIICRKTMYHIDEVKQVYTLKNLKIEGVFSHFSVSDSLNHDDLEYTAQQIECYEKVLADLKKAGLNPGLRHIQNSYGILNYSHLQYDYARTGLLLFGVTGNDEISIRTSPRFQPIMSLKANVSLVKEVEAGVSISYGRNFTTANEAKIATISIGYADGVSRSISNRFKEVSIHGQRVPMIGNICMDQILIDVSSVDDVQEGDVVTLIGKDNDQELKIDEFTRLAETINNESLCWWSARIPRFYKQ